MSKELATKYDHLAVENGKYQKWLDHGCFKSGDKSKPGYCIVIPPPNVTGKLHIGHTTDESLQDMLTRYKRLKGFDALYLPGMDHAGIATQAKVEARLREKGISRYDLGREKFLEQVWAWKDEYADTIHQQWAKEGLCLDYSKERFTLDEGLSDAVKEVFITLYNKGLIYRGKRIINWDPVQRTALSNIEVIYEETESKMYYFKYVFEGSKDFLTVATTRPETMFGDVCVVVNPKDKRYKSAVGKKVINPANGDLLPIIADEYVDIEFGTGAMKCTPAHDPNDFAISEKYHLEKPICMNPDGTMNEICGKYKGMDRMVCRNTLVDDIDKAGLLIKIEKHINQVGYSERSHAIVEPYLSDQWFVKMEPLAKQALDFQQTADKIKFYPDRFEKIFTNWMTGIEDWCISRQLWWGHRIPAWYHKDTGEIHVGKEAPKDIENWDQDPDVLDTWFSSALWPFSTLGWPAKTEDLERYFPTDVLVTGYDIIFFWVARMIFQSLEFTKQKPFKDCLIHGLIRDSEGRKMSKSLGNGIDPMEVIDQYGADALRWFLTASASPGLDMRYSEEKIQAAWNFINKIWNASRFVMLNLGDDFKPTEIKYNELTDVDKWIIARLNKTIESVDENMDKYEFVVVGTYLYNFIWDDFCSWYIELAKVNLSGADFKVKKQTQNVLYYVLDSITKLIHPFMPFVSEEIYQTLHNNDQIFIINDKWPKAYEYGAKDDSSQSIEMIIETIKRIRNYKSENKMLPNAKIAIKMVSKSLQRKEAIKRNAAYLKRFGFVDDLSIDDILDKSEDGAFFSVGNGIDMLIPLKGNIDTKVEKERLKLELLRLEAELKRSNAILNNKAFVAKAPAAKVEQEKAKLADYNSQYKSIKEKLDLLK
ncbi:MAG: valine--tRNA ligase [Bacilli bacterium]|nr:valine--tRNA ligase [Bacilli bacterium]